MRKIWTLFAVFLALFTFITFGDLRIGAEGATASAWMTLMLGVTSLAIVPLVKNGLPDKRCIGISLLLGLLVVIAGFGVHMSIHFGMLPLAVVTLLCALAMFSVFRAHPEQALRLLKNDSAQSAAGSVAIGLAVGIVCGGINLFLSGEELRLRVTPAAFLVALNPGVYEEIAFRAFLFAACLYCLRGGVHSKTQHFTLWFMMIVPHVLIHTPDMFLEQGLIAGLGSILVLTALFGMPFAVLQRKRDIISAMVAHGVVMVIRFSFLGIPV
ncbi:MAG: hypothetical protein FWE12_08810 [Oscillospiraceae bacterium]|nr:hypothetical protein [Oscillospiraceae bacterium]